MKTDRCVPFVRLTECLKCLYLLQQIKVDRQNLTLAASNLYKKVKAFNTRAEVAQGVPDRLRHRIFLTFGTTRVVGRQPYATAAFTPGETPGTHF
jgi:hypothetical protein